VKAEGLHIASVMRCAAPLLLAGGIGILSPTRSGWGYLDAIALISAISSHIQEFNLLLFEWQVA
jgi:hypothetical protein